MSFDPRKQKNCACRSLRGALREDLHASIAPDETHLPWLKVFAVIATTPRHRAMVTFRVAHWLQMRGVKLVPRLLQAHIQRIAGADIHPGAHIAGGMSIVHSVGLVIGERVVAGRQLRLHQNVTIGERGDGPQQPLLGDNVILGAGSVVMGGVTVGDNAVIGANAVITRDVEPNAVMVGGNTRQLDNVRI